MNQLKVTYAYDDMKSDLFEIIRKIESANWQPTVILGIGRGGYVPAVYLSQWYSIPLFTMHLSFRDMERFDLMHTSVYTTLLSSEVLVVDDICDSGETLVEAEDQLKGFGVQNLKTATLIHNVGQNLFDPDYYGREINKIERPCWIMFPWENWWNYVG